MIRTLLIFFIGASAFAGEPVNGVALLEGEQRSRLPYIGAAHCKEAGQPSVVVPKDKNNGGYLTDASCQTIFVKPPAKGSMSIISSFTNRIQLCKNLDALYEQLELLTSQFTRYVKEKSKLDERAEDMSLEEVLRESRRLGMIRKELTDQVNEFIGDTSPIESAMGSISNVSMFLEWDSLTEQYRRLNNPSYTVQRMPLTTSHVVYTATNQNDERMLNELLEDGTRLDPVISAKVPAVQSKLPKDWITTDGSVNAIDIGNSLSGQLKLNLLGACPIYRSKDVPMGMAPYFVANMTYTYPVHSDAKYEVHLDVDAFAKVIKQQIKKNGKIDTSAVLAKTYKGNQTGSLRVINTQDSQGNELSEDIKEAVKEDVANSTINSFLDSIGVISAVPPDNFLEAPDPSDPTRRETRVDKGCKRKKFLGVTYKKKCWKRVYSVKVPVDSIKKSVIDFEKTLKLNNESKFVQFNTYQSTDTLGFSRVQGE